MLTGLNRRTTFAVLRLRSVLVRSWDEARPAARPAPLGLDIALRPSPCARRLFAVWLALQFLYALELAWIGSWPGAIGALGLGFVSLTWSRRQRRQDSGRLRRLIVGADGRLHGLTQGGQVLALQLHPASLALGQWLLLGLCTSGRAQVWLLGPDNLDGQSLATLRRRLGRAPAHDFG
jgi:hypothetical protein